MKQIAIDKDWLEEQYCKLKRTQEDIAREVGCCSFTVRKNCTKYGFKKQILVGREWLKQQYCDLKRTHKDIADEIGCSDVLIGRYCRRWGFEKPKRPDKNRIDLTGREVGDLKVINYEYTIKKTAYWMCLCKCGISKVINGTHLNSGMIRSCGCWTNRPSKKRNGYKDIPSSYIRDIRKKGVMRGYAFDITPKEMWDQYISQNKLCALSGEPIGFPSNQNKAYRSCKTASLDRIDSTKGYVSGNIQWVHKHINIMKQDLADEEFIAWCKKVSRHTKNKAL